MSIFSANKIVTRRLEQSDSVNQSSTATQTFMFSEIDTTNKTTGIGIHQTYDYSLSFAGNIQAAGKIRLLGKYYSGVSSKWFTVEYHFADGDVTYEDAINIIPDQIEMNIVRTYSSPNTTLAIKVRHRVYTTLYFTTFVEGYAFKSIGNASTIALGSDLFGNRGVFAGGHDPLGATHEIVYIAIDTPTTVTDFDNLSAARYSPAGTSDASRGLFGGGDTGSYSNVIDYITIATPAVAADFGDLTVARSYISAASDGSRGIWAGGQTGSVSDVMDYIDISIPNNATDFGNLSVARLGAAATADGATAVFGGGTTGSIVDRIDFHSIATLGNAHNFGSLISAKNHVGACTDGSIGVFAGGAPTTDAMDYITISTPVSTAANWGNLTVAREGLGGTSNGPRGVFGGGYISANSDVIDYFAIATPATTASDWGDLINANRYLAATSGD